MKLRAAIHHWVQGQPGWPARLILALILTLMVAINVCSAQVAVPKLASRVTDLTGTLTGEQRAALETKLQAFEAAKGSQIAVLLVPTTAPEAIEQYAIRVVDAWKLGREKADDGALLLVAKNDRAVRIEVGRGLEGALNDATANRITDDIIVPQFRAGDFYGGIGAGVDSMIKVIEGEPLPPPEPRQARGQGGGRRGAGLESVFVIALVGATFAGAFLRRMLGRLPGAAATGAGVGFLAWLIAGGVFIAIVGAVIAFIATLLGGSRRGLTSGALPGVWSGGGGWGSGGGGGFGGGGFGGGGGSFGGGGATGRW